MNRTNLMKLQKNRLFEERFAKNVLIANRKCNYTYGNGYIYNY